jgi:hypothetical protein
MVNGKESTRVLDFALRQSIGGQDVVAISFSFSYILQSIYAFVA